MKTTPARTSSSASPPLAALLTASWLNCWKTTSATTCPSIPNRRKRPPTMSSTSSARILSKTEQGRLSSHFSISTLHEDLVGWIHRHRRILSVAMDCHSPQLRNFHTCYGG